MVERVEGYPLLAGVRGEKPVAIDLPSESLLRLSQLSRRLRRELAELDLNPFIVTGRPSPVVVVDARVILGRRRAERGRSGGGAPRAPRSEPDHCFQSRRRLQAQRRAQLAARGRANAAALRSRRKRCDSACQRGHAPQLVQHRVGQRVDPPLELLAALAPGRLQLRRAATACPRATGAGGIASRP